MTVKVYKLNYDSETVFVTTRAVRIAVENNNIVIEYGVGFFRTFDSKFYGCYVVA